MKQVFANAIYTALDGPEREYYLVCFSGYFNIVDALPCDEHGNIPKGYISGVPVHTDNIGELVSFDCPMCGADMS